MDQHHYRLSANEQDRKQIKTQPLFHGDARRISDIMQGRHTRYDQDNHGRTTFRPGWPAQSACRAPEHAMLAEKSDLFRAGDTPTPVVPLPDILISEILGAQYFRYEGKRPGCVHRKCRYREAVPYWIRCASVCSVYSNFRYETDAPKVPKIEVHRKFVKLRYPVMPQ